MDGAPLDPDQFTAIARLPGVEVLRGQLLGAVASPLTGLARGLSSMISGVAVALGQIAEQGLVGGEAGEPAPETQTLAEEAAGEESAGEEGADEHSAPEEGAEGEPADAADEAAGGGIGGRGPRDFR